MTEILKAIIVDDEPKALKGLEGYIKQIPYIQIVGLCQNATDAKEELDKQPIDLMFLDIEMPKINGLEFFKTLNIKPITIITSAFSEYAIEGFELEVIDYLLKPFSKERLQKATKKALEYYHYLKTQQNFVSPTSDFIFIKANKKIEKIFFKDIQYIEALQNYVAIYTNNSKHITYSTLKNVENILPKNEFIKVQKSFIVSLQKITEIVNDEVIVANRKIALSRINKTEIINTILSSNLISRRV